MAYFSIIIPNYNSEKTIRKCLDSVLSQTFTDYEVIIVDDMSTDNSVNIIKEYKDDRIKLMELNFKAYNGGTRNIGVFNAIGNYILFLDCDDWIYSKDSLKAIYEVSSISKSDLIRLPYVAHKNGGEGKIMLKEKTIKDMAHTAFVAPWTKCIKKEKFVEFPENTLLEDVVQHIAQIDNIETISVCKTPYAVWNRDNANAISSDTARYDENSKRYSSVYRNVADLIDLQLNNEECKKERQNRINAYKIIIKEDKILNLINGGESQ